MCFCIRPWGCFRYACLKSTLCMLLHLSALIALMRGLSMSPPRCPCPVFCMYLSVEACLSPSLPFAVFALRLVGCDNVCCSSLVLSITAGSGRFPAVNSQSIYVPFGLVNSKTYIYKCLLTWPLLPCMTASSKPFVLAFVIGPAMIFPF